MEMMHRHDVWKGAQSSLLPISGHSTPSNLHVLPKNTWAPSFEVLWRHKWVNHWPLVTAAATAAKSIWSCPTLCDPIDGSPPGSPVPGILQARTLEWVAISFSNAWKWSESEVAQSCLTLSDPMDYSLPGSSIHGIFQARVLEWVPLPSPLNELASFFS